ncbi:MAG: PQQ-dependent sugar dehydrogenase [Rhizobiaceae bacterium]|nr:PQQ-dependent sugar dehydrogenase [Rhizobiaceae bacterium]
MTLTIFRFSFTAISLLVLSTLALAGSATAQTFSTSAGKVKVETVATGLSNPWAVAFLPGGNFLVTERSGAMRIVGADGTLGGPLEGVPDVVAEGQGGLLDVVLAPDFEKSGTLFLSFSEPGAKGGTGTAVMRANLVRDGALKGRLEGGEVIFRMNKFTNFGLHFGSRIVVARDGNLFITLGDRGEMNRAQDFADLAGGVVRISPDGSIPSDNPYLGQSDIAPEFWSVGHRNAQGAALRPSDGSLWTVEHGAQGGDEINKPLGGLNYGWPVITFGTNYGGAKIGVGTEAEGMQQPVYYWDPSIAPSGLAFYQGELFPDWNGDLLVGALKDRMMVRLEMDGDKVVSEERLLQDEFGRIRDVRVGPKGAIYLLIDDANGSLLKVTPAK